jgi:hypothetical protein
VLISFTREQGVRELSEPEFQYTGYIVDVRNMLFSMEIDISAIYKEVCTRG